jgi:hypothetical protein
MLVTRQKLVEQAERLERVLVQPLAQTVNLVAVVEL